MFPRTLTTIQFLTHSLILVLLQAEQRIAFDSKKHNITDQDKVR